MISGRKYGRYKERPPELEQRAVASWRGRGWKATVFWQASLPRQYMLQRSDAEVAIIPRGMCTTILVTINSEMGIDEGGSRALLNMP